MAFFDYQGSCSSSLFRKDLDNMLPFNSHSVWNFAANGSPNKLSARPIVTTSSVLGIVYNEGVMICADNVGSYGSLQYLFDIERVKKVNEHTLIGVGGDIADFQYLQSVIEQSVISDECLNDGFFLKPKSLHSWLTRTFYNRRSKFEPLWNVVAVGGMQDGVPFLGYVDKIGTAFEARSVASGYGSYIAQPMLRDAIEKNPDLTQHDAQKLLSEAMVTLYKRDCTAFLKYTLGIANKDGVQVSKPISINVDWSIAHLSKDM